MLEEQKI